MTASTDLGPLDRLTALAEALAGSWGARGRGCTTAGQERAALRLIGVTGLDRSGRPLAAEVVERYVAGRRDRLAGGVILPFAAALVEYDTGPLELALDVASGAVDLILEAEILRDTERRAAAEAVARRLAGAALERIDANRTARLELLDVIGDADRPWIGATLAAPTVAAGIREAAELVAGGVDVVQVSVPAVRELAERLHDAGIEVPFWRPRPALGAIAAAEAGEPPSGSQRGLAELRQTVDAAAAERRAYARLATVAMPLAAPEQAVVAAFERIDVVTSDPVAEIVDGNIDPDRALADHAFARRILARSGASVLVGSGPLVVGPDLARGIPSDATTRAGRSLALQLVAVALARQGGIPAARVLVGSLPGWLLGERLPATAAMAQIVVRRALLPEHPLAFEEPAPGEPGAARWPAVMGAALPLAGAAGLIVRAARRDGTTEAMTKIAGGTRSVASVAGEVAGSVGPLELRGPALEFAQRTVAAAVDTLERLARDGWPSILGDPIGSEPHGRVGGESVVERSEAFDPFATPTGIAGLP